DVLSTFFGLLALESYRRYVANPLARNYLLIVLTYTLSLLAKPMLVTLPALLLVLDFWPLGRIKLDQTGFPRLQGSWRILLLEKILLVGIAAGFAIITFYAQQQQGLIQSFEYLPIGTRLSNALVSYIRYLGMLFWPSPLAAYYPHPSDRLA